MGPNTSLLPASAASTVLPTCRKGVLSEGYPGTKPGLFGSYSGTLAITRVHYTRVPWVFPEYTILGCPGYPQSTSYSGTLGISRVRNTRVPWVSPEYIILRYPGYLQSTSYYCKHTLQVLRWLSSRRQYENFGACLLIPPEANQNNEITTILLSRGTTVSRTHDTTQTYTIHNFC